jgi:branched-chain amino acid transport system ATP-binding protein
MKALLRIDNLVASYGAAEVLHGISLTVDPGEFVCVIGANTAGKSTVVRSVSRQVPRTSGTIAFDGRDLMRLRPHQVPALGIAHVPEGRQVFPGMTVEENLLLGAFSVRSESGLHNRLESIFALFPRLAERRTQLAGTLSGGEQQMVAVGRALMLKPKLLMLDEPSHGLAPRVVDEMHQAFVRIHQEGAAVLLIEQNTAMALELASRGYVLERGSIVLQGSTIELRSDPNVRAAYLGV